MNITAIIQARMSSSRFPGKVLQPFRGRPLLDYLIERLERSDEIDSICVATSSEASDLPIVDYCHNGGIRVFCGPLENVSARYDALLRSMTTDAFVRICADSPWYDPALLDDLIRYFKSHPCDIVTNRNPRTYPRGQSMEILSKRSFCAAFPQMTTKEDLEHVTHFFYTQPEKFVIKNRPNPAGDFSHVNLCVDTPDDFGKFCMIMDSLDQDWASLGWREITALYADLLKAGRA